MRNSVAPLMFTIRPGYLYYRSSSAKKALDAFSQAQVYLQQATRRKVDGEPNTFQTIAYLRKIAKSYVVFIPGADRLVDDMFTSVDGIVDSYEAEARTIVTTAYQEVRDIIQESKDKNSADTARRVLGALGKSMGQLHALGGKTGGNALDYLRVRHPNAMENIYGGLAQAQKLAEGTGPKAMKILDGTQQQVSALLRGRLRPSKCYCQVKAIMSQGVNSEAVQRARSIWDKMPVRRATKAEDDQPESRRSAASEHDPDA